MPNGKEIKVKGRTFNKSGSKGGNITIIITDKGQDTQHSGRWLMHEGNGYHGTPKGIKRILNLALESEEAKARRASNEARKFDEAFESAQKFMNEAAASNAANTLALERVIAKLKNDQNARRVMASSALIKQLAKRLNQAWKNKEASSLQAVQRKRVSGNSDPRRNAGGNAHRTNANN